MPIRIRKMAFRVLLIIVGVYAGLALLGYVFQSRLLYFPTRAMDETPADVALTYDDVTFDAADGVRLNGWFVPAGDNPRATVIFCHGNAVNISGLMETVRILHNLRLNVFIFDYRGYGKSEGKPTEEGTYLDADAAWRYLTEVKGIAPEEIIVHGRSLGGGVAAHLAGSRSPRMLILESTFTSVPDRAAEMYPLFPVRLICRFRYGNEAVVGKLNCPTLIIHSPDDRLIPIRHGRKLFAAANEPKEFLEIRGDHNSGFLTSRRVYTEGLDRFVSSALQTSGPQKSE
jgi:fermentation-respiration switch protein FrsA (DUF1100 family)